MNGSPCHAALRDDLRAVTLGAVAGLFLVVGLGTLVGSASAQDGFMVVCNGTQSSWTDLDGTVHVTQNDPVDCCTPVKKLQYAFAHQRQALTAGQAIDLGKMTIWISKNCPK